MPVNALIAGSRLQLRLITGQDLEGNPVLRSRSYSNIKGFASDEALYETGSALAGLQQFPLDELRRINEYVLIES